MTEEEMHKALDIRNEATKVWIQSDTQCRKYTCQLEFQLTVFRQALSDIVGMCKCSGQCDCSISAAVRLAMQTLEKMRVVPGIN